MLTQTSILRSWCLCRFITRFWILFCNMVKLFAGKSEKNNNHVIFCWYPLTEATISQLRELEAFDLQKLDLFAREVCRTGKRMKRWVKSKVTAALTSLCSVLNSKLFWEAGVFPTRPLSVYELRLWFGRFTCPAMEDVFLFGACKCVSVGAADCEIWSSGFFWQV